MLVYAVSFNDSLDYAHRGVIGIRFDKQPDGSAIVLGTVHGSPAERAGLKVGDRLLWIGDQLVKPETDISELFVWFRGDPGTPVNVRVLGSDNQQHEFTITRSKNPADLAYAWEQFGQTLVYFLSGLLIFWKLRGSGYALFVSISLVLFGMSVSGLASSSGLLGQFLVAFGPVLALFVLLTYPNGSLEFIHLSPGIHKFYTSIG